MKVIFIAGSFGSGTSALAGALDQLGLASLPPHFMTNDVRTPNSFESLAFRQLVNAFANEATLSVDESKAGKFIQDLKNLLGQADGGLAGAVMLKMPLASICLPQIIAAVDPYVIVMHRPFGEIEASRVRRGWPPQLGGAGAQVIYSKLLTSLIEQQKSCFALSYRDLQQNCRHELLRVLQFCGLEQLSDQIDKAVEFVRPSHGS